ncbi:MAG: hypothetical protein Q8L14_18745 [Myxococcales bacterium]|nr:hypothetical protein [Myxococcales bacterium]
MFWLAVVVLFASCNCGGDGPQADAGIDAGNSTGRQDAGLDAGTMVDAGLDAGATVDAGLDAGAMEDAGVDAGLVDSGVEVDGGLDAGSMTADASVLNVDFEMTFPPDFDAGSAVLTPSQGYAPLGPPGNTFGPTFLRAPTGNIITLTVSNLPPHTSLSVDFLFAAIDSLDGTGSFPAGDFFRVDVDGVTIFRESFANATPSQVQSYVAPVPAIVLARRVDLGFAGPGGFYTDSAYDMSLEPRFDDLPHTAPTATLTFQLEGAGVQALSDESWAIDNVRLIVGNTPRARDGGM